MSHQTISGQDERGGHFWRCSCGEGSGDVRYRSAVDAAKRADRHRDAANAAESTDDRDESTLSTFGADILAGFAEEGYADPALDAAFDAIPVPTESPNDPSLFVLPEQPIRATGIVKED